MCPVITPYWFAIFVNMPSVKRPSNGPPTTPNIVNEACNTPPKFCVRNATPTQTMPKMVDKIFDGNAELFSDGS